MGLVPVASRLASGSLGFFVRQVLASQGCKEQPGPFASLLGSKSVGSHVPASAPEQGLRAEQWVLRTTPLVFWSVPMGCRRLAGRGLCEGQPRAPSALHIREGAPFPLHSEQIAPPPLALPRAPTAGCLASLAQGGPGPQPAAGPTPQLFFHLELPRGRLAAKPGLG